MEALCGIVKRPLGRGGVWSFFPSFFALINIGVQPAFWGVSFLLSPGREVEIPHIVYLCEPRIGKLTVLRINEWVKIQTPSNFPHEESLFFFFLVKR